MKTIVIDEIIGFCDMDGPWLRGELEKAGGDEIRVEIASPGGFVFDGLEMFNLLKNYSGKVYVHIMGLAASIASYLAMSGDIITAESNAVLMIHNARMSIGGDYREFEKAADFLNGITGILARQYSLKSGKSLSEIRNLMDDETFFFGEEILNDGFVDEIIPGKNKEIKTDAVAYAKIEVEEMANKLVAHKENKSKIAALMNYDFKNNLDEPEASVNAYDSGAKLVDEPWSKTESETRWRRHAGIKTRDDLPNRTYRKRFVWYDSNNQKSLSEGYKFPIWDYKNGEFVNIAAVRNGLARLGPSKIPENEKNRIRSVLERYLNRFKETQDLNTGPDNGAGKIKYKEYNDMTVEEMAKNLQNENPALYDFVLGQGREKELKRVKSHLVLGKKTGAHDYMCECIESGSSITDEDVQAKYIVAGLDRKDISNRIEDNPDSVVVPENTEDIEEDAIMAKVKENLGIKEVDNG